MVIGVFRSVDKVWRIEVKKVRGYASYWVWKSGFLVGERLPTPEAVAEVMRQHHGPDMADLIED